MARDTYVKVSKAEALRNKILTTKAIEGTMEVMPNPNYKAMQVFRCFGLGDIFNGNYYVRKVTHTFNDSGYNISLDVVCIDHVSNASISLKSKSLRPRQLIKHK